VRFSTVDPASDDVRLGIESVAKCDVLELFAQQPINWFTSQHASPPRPWQPVEKATRQYDPDADARLLSMVLNSPASSGKPKHGKNPSRYFITRRFCTFLSIICVKMC